MLTDKEVFEYHGYEEQCKHITSEMHELTSAIQKYEISKKFYVTDTETLMNIHEEIADVEFMLNQIKERYSIKEEYVNGWGKFKRERESKRIKEGYYEKKNE